LLKSNNTLFVGKVLHEFDALPSTNILANEWLVENKVVEGTVILTHDQYAGKGQATNKWESAPHKNLTFSVILLPKFLLARKQFLLNQVVSLSVFDTLKEYIGEGLAIKWPNDIYVFNKKITGILIQNNLRGSTLQSSIVGIGLNVNQKQFISDAPNPTSIQQRYLDSLFRFGKTCPYRRLDGTIFKGEIQGVTDIGKLKMKTDVGMEEFAFKEVGYILN